MTPKAVREALGARPGDELELVARGALRLLGERSRLDFADAYLAALALEIGPAAVAWFDADLEVIEGVRRISA